MKNHDSRETPSLPLYTVAELHITRPQNCIYKKMQVDVFVTWILLDESSCICVIDWAQPCRDGLMDDTESTRNR